jgi:hypothetical protein
MKVIDFKQATPGQDLEKAIEAMKNNKGILLTIDKDGALDRFSFNGLKSNDAVYLLHWAIQSLYIDDGLIP